MKIKSQKPIFTLDGKTIPTSELDRSEFTVGKAVANVLMSHKGKKLDAFKLWNLGKRFYNSKGLIDLDEADFQAIKTIVEEDQNYSAMVLGQIIEAFNKSKELKVVNE